MEFLVHEQMVNSKLIKSMIWEKALPSLSPYRSLYFICPPNCTNLTKFAVVCSSEMYQWVSHIHSACTDHAVACSSEMYQWASHIHSVAQIMLFLPHFNSNFNKLNLRTCCIFFTLKRMHQVKKKLATLLSSLLSFRKHQPTPPTVLYLPSLSYTTIYYFCTIFKKSQFLIFTFNVHMKQYLYTIQ